MCNAHCLQVGCIAIFYSWATKCSWRSSRNVNSVFFCEDTEREDREKRDLLAYFGSEEHLSMTSVKRRCDTWHRDRLAVKQPTTEDE